MLPLCPCRTGQDVGGTGLEGEFGRLQAWGAAAAEPHPARGLQRDAADIAERRRIAVPADPRAGRVARHEQVRQLPGFASHQRGATLPPGKNPTCVVVLADPDDPDLFDYDSRFESTHRPCDLPWGLGGPADAQQWLADHHPEPDQVEIIDRPFLLQYHGDRLTPRVAQPSRRRLGTASGTAPGT